MALVQCPECLGSVSESAEVCVHCGFPIKKYLKNKTQNKVDNSEIRQKDKSKTAYVVLVALLLVVLSVVAVSHASKQAEIKKYRVEFSSEDEMREVLRSGKWWLTSRAGGYPIGGYVSFEHSYSNYYVENTSDTPLRMQYKLDYKNSSILTTDGSFYYDVIYYKGDYYLRQNPKVEIDRWILFRLS